MQSGLRDSGFRRVGLKPDPGRTVDLSPEFLGFRVIRVEGLGFMRVYMYKGFLRLHVPVWYRLWPQGTYIGTPFTVSLYHNVGT